MQEQIVRKMPKPKRHTEVQGIHKKKSNTSDGPRAGPGAPRSHTEEVGGVSVGSWVFDPSEFQEMKRALLEEEAKEGKTKALKVEKIEEGGEDDEEDYRTTPVASPHLSPAHVPSVASALSALPLPPSPSPLPPLPPSPPPPPRCPIRGSSRTVGFLSRTMCWTRSQRRRCRIRWMGGWVGCRRWGS